MVEDQDPTKIPQHIAMGTPVVTFKHTAVAPELHGTGEGATPTSPPPTLVGPVEQKSEWRYGYEAIRDSLQRV